MIISHTQLNILIGCLAFTVIYSLTSEFNPWYSISSIDKEKLRSSKIFRRIHWEGKDDYSMDDFVFNTWHMILMAYEIADRLVDLFTANNYKDGNITNNPKESVYIALMVIFCLSLPVTALRVFLYLFRRHLYRSGDDSNDKVHHAINMLMSWAKMLFEAFPQATIALFYFGDCAPTNSTKTAVQAFNTFSIFPFIMSICYAVFYFYAHVEMAGRWIAYSTALLTQFLICLTGCIFAGISINNFNEPCMWKPF